MAEQDDKKFPASTESARGLLNMDSSQPDAEPEQVTAAGEAPEDLPFMDTLENVFPDVVQQPLELPEEIVSPIGGPAPSGHTDPISQLTKPAEKKGSELFAIVLWLVKTALPYVVIFAIGLGLYFFYFSDFSFNSIFNSDRLRLETISEKSRNKDLEALKKDVKSEYLTWMRQFFFDVNDEDIISMDTDVSGNGLSNLEKYLLNLNPKVYSTRGTAGDGQMVIEGINPWTGKPFTEEQKALVDKYINKELISNRITAAALSRGVTKFAQYVNDDSPYYIDPETLRQVSRDNPVLSGGNPGSVTPAFIPVYTGAGSNVAPGSTSPVVARNGTQIDETIAGRLEIPANNISVPLIWTKDVKDFDKDLEQGVVHYPGTALPGEMGTAYISGHSSGYLWDKSPYKQIFAILGQVKDGTSFTITAQQVDGKQVKFHYVVDHRGEFAAEDQAQFVSTADSMVALSTCWPVGTTNRRLVLFAKLTQTERP